MATPLSIVKSVEGTVNGNGNLSSGWRMLIEVICAVLIAGCGSYFTIAQTMVSRAEAKQMVAESEARSNAAIQKLEAKQDQMLEKLEDIRVNVEVMRHRDNGKK